MRRFSLYRLSAPIRNGPIGWSLADQILSRGFNLTILGLAAHGLGLKGFGLFTLLWLVKPLSDAFQISCILAPMESLMPKQGKISLNQYFTVLVIHQATLSFATIILFTMVIGASAFLLPALSPIVLFLLLLAILANQVHEFFLKFFFSRMKAFNAFALNTVKGVIQFSLVLLVSIFGELSLDRLLSILAVGLILPALASLRFLPRINYNRDTLQGLTRRHLRFSSWLLGSLLLTYSSTHFYLPLVGVLFGLEVVGGLRAVVTLVSLVAIIPDALARLVFPKSAVHFSRFGWQGLVDYLRKVILVNSVSVLVGGFVLILLSDFLLGSLFGPEFLQFAFLTKWYILVLLLRYLELPIVSVFRTLEVTKFILLLELAKCITFFGSIYLLHAEGSGPSSAPQGIVLGQLVFIALSLTITSKMASNNQA